MNRSRDFYIGGLNEDSLACLLRNGYRVSTEISTKEERPPSKHVTYFSTGYPPTPNFFCFDCAFLPEPHELCLTHSLQQQQRSDLGLEDGRRSGSDIGREGKEEGGPQLILHSTPRAGESQLVVTVLDVLQM